LPHIFVLYFEYRLTEFFLALGSAHGTAWYKYSFSELVIFQLSNCLLVVVLVNL